MSSIQRRISWRTLLVVAVATFIFVVLISAGVLFYRGSADSVRALRDNPAVASLPAPAAPRVELKPDLPPVPPPVIAPAPSAPVNPAAPAPLTQPVSVEKIQAAAAKFKQDFGARPKILAERMKDMARSSEFDARVVLALAGEAWSDEAAVTALGLVKFPALKDETLNLLWSKTRGADSAVVCAALKSYGQVAGSEAAPKLGEYIQSNYRRPDGLGEQVCGGAADSLAEISGDASLGVLLSELRRVDQRDWMPDYGSRVVTALGRHDQLNAGTGWMPKTRKPELRGKNKVQIRRALLEYAERLRARLPGPTDPNGQRYLEEKIDEAVKLATPDGMPPS